MKITTEAHKSSHVRKNNNSDKEMTQYESDKELTVNKGEENNRPAYKPSQAS